MRKRTVRTIQKEIAPILGALVLAALPVEALGGGDDVLSWRGRSYELDELPAELPAETLDAIDLWGDWAFSREYVMAASEDGTVLLVHALKKRTLARHMERIDETVEGFGEMFPGTSFDFVAGAPLPGGDLGERETAVMRPGPERHGPRAAMLFHLENVEHYHELLDRARELNPWLGSWVETAKRTAGCHIEDPLLAVWREDVKGQEEYDVQNEIVHRLAHLLVLRRFGQQPYWLQMGVAWNLENDVRGNIYVFPYRNGFVSIGEHGDWDNDLKRMFKKSKTLSIEDVALLHRGVYESNAARTAFGTVAFLAQHRPGALSGIMEDLRIIREDKGILREGNRWQLIPDFEVSAADQAAVFQHHAGEALWDELLKFFQKGKRFRPSKRG